MGKQTKILYEIIEHFKTRQATIINEQIKEESEVIRAAFKKSNNKSDIVRRILKEVVLSNDEIVSLMRILYKKKESKK